MLLSSFCLAYSAPHSFRLISTFVNLPESLNFACFLFLHVDAQPAVTSVLLVFDIIPFTLLSLSAYSPSLSNVPSVPLICFTSVLCLIPFAMSPFNPRVSLVNPLSPLIHFTPCPSAPSYFHIPELIPLSPRLQPVVFPVSLLIRLSLALVLLIPEGFVYLCWSCFYSLRLTPPIFSPVI